ncbi:response regulator [Bogoriella caseilytica]|nr:response regulator transcription factor [Bogoriella caseilytica]
MIRVAIVDDDPLVRRLLTTVLSTDDTEIVAEAGDGDEAVALVHAHRPDVLVMDLRMRRMGGVDAIHALRAQPDPPAVLALTSLGAEEAALDAVRAGAEGFLTKDAGPMEIREAVRDLARGEGSLSPRAARLLMAEVAASSRHESTQRAEHLVRGLTDREREMAVDAAAGRTNSSIAERHYLSEATVKSHLARAMAKLQVENRASLAVVMDRAGFGPS